MFLCFFKFQETKKSIYLFLGGLNLSLLFFLKGNFILLGLPIVVELILQNYHIRHTASCEISELKFRNYKNIKRLILDPLIFTFPLILQTIFWFAYFYLHHALGDFLLASFLFSSKYLKSAWQGRVSPHLIFILILLPLFIPLGIFIMKFLKDYRIIFKKQILRFLFFLLLSSLILGFGMGSFYPYYFLVLLPGFILIMLYSSDVFFEIKKRRNILILIILLLGMFSSFIISYKQFYNYFSGPAKKETLEFQAIASYIKERTTKEDKIIAYTYGATFYRLTERDSASRFVSASILLLDEREGYGFNLSQIFIDEIEKNKPKYLIFSQKEDDFYLQNKKIVNYIKENFIEEKAFDEFAILKNKNF